MTSTTDHLASTTAHLARMASTSLTFLDDIGYGSDDSDSHSTRLLTLAHFLTRRVSMTLAIVQITACTSITL
jgi:DNA replication protein DnaC